MAPHIKRTVLVNTSDFPVGSSKKDIVSQVVDSSPEDTVEALRRLVLWALGRFVVMLFALCQLLP